MPAAVRPRRRWRRAVPNPGRRTGRGRGCACTRPARGGRAPPRWRRSRAPVMTRSVSASRSSDFVMFSAVCLPTFPRFRKNPCLSWRDVPGLGHLASRRSTVLELVAPDAPAEEAPERTRQRGLPGDAAVRLELDHGVRHGVRHAQLHRHAERRARTRRRAGARLFGLDHAGPSRRSRDAARRRPRRRRWIAAGGCLMTRSTLTRSGSCPHGPSSVSSGPGRSPRLDGVGDQVAQLHPLERRGVGRGQDDRRCHAGLEGLLPARRAQAPLVTGLQPGEAELGVRGGQVVADRRRERQELRR